MQTGPCPRASRTRHSAFRCSHVGFYQKSTAPAAGRGRCLAQRRPAGRRGARSWIQASACRDRSTFAADLQGPGLGERQPTQLPPRPFKPNPPCLAFGPPRATSSPRPSGPTIGLGASVGWSSVPGCRRGCGPPLRQEDRSWTSTGTPKRSSGWGQVVSGQLVSVPTNERNE